MRNRFRHFAPIVLMAQVGLVIQSDAATSGRSPAQERVLHGFRGARDGASPSGALIADSSGALYGTTTYCGRAPCRASGGPTGQGEVFKLTPERHGYDKTTLYRFEGGRDGGNPIAGLVADANGALYGTTSVGGEKQNGTVFKLIPSGSRYVKRVVYRFEGGNDGAYPTGALSADETGALYGTTAAGGNPTCVYFFKGCGTVFKLTRSGLGYSESILYRFSGGNDGVGPFSGVIADKTGVLYGSTNYGGGSTCNSGCGTVFKLTPSGSGYAESIIYRFKGGKDGANPFSSLFGDGTGALYGTTVNGGSTCAIIGCGTVFKLTPTGSGYAEHVLYRFRLGSNGYQPAAGVIVDGRGVVYGTTISGGSPSISGGVVFKLTPAGSAYTESVLYTFQGGVDGVNPASDLLVRSGAFYGTTGHGGGQCNCGTVFKLAL
jgi:uncharacterized repeat protein (TIGR03803 family)